MFRTSFTGTGRLSPMDFYASNIFIIIKVQQRLSWKGFDDLSCIFEYILEIVLASILFIHPDDLE